MEKYETKLSQLAEWIKQSTQLKKYPNLYFQMKDEEYISNALLYQIGNVPTEENYVRTLTDCFASLQRICENSESVAMLTQDFVIHSFCFSVYKKGNAKYDFNGGIILHNAGQETFSVELIPNFKPHWSIHT